MVKWSYFLQFRFHHTENCVGQIKIVWKDFQTSIAMVLLYLIYSLKLIEQQEILVEMYAVFFPAVLAQQEACQNQNISCQTDHVSKCWMICLNICLNIFVYLNNKSYFAFNTILNKIFWADVHNQKEFAWQNTVCLHVQAICL